MTRYVLKLFIYTVTFYSFHMLWSFFKVSVWDPIHSPYDCCWSCDNTWNIWLWDKTFISYRWPAENFPRFMLVKKFNLQIIFMYIHFSHCANPTKCIVDTADIQKTLDVFYIYFFGQSFVEIKLKKLYPHLLVYEQFCWKILV